MAAKKKPLLTVGVGPRPAAPSGPGPTPIGLPTPGPGRPKSNIGQYLIKPTAEVDSGFEMINTEPNVLKAVHQQYLKSGELPPALQPKYLRRPEAMDTGRRKAISKGFNKPRSRQG